MDDMHMRKFLLLLAGAALASAQQYSISTVAGGAPPATPATAASTPSGPEPRDGRWRRQYLFQRAAIPSSSLTGNGALTLVAGNSRAGFSGDGGPAVSAS